MLNTGEQISDAADPVANDESGTLNAVAEEHVGSHQESKQVPLDALQAERAERQKLQDEVKMMKEYMSLIQSRQSSNQPKQQDEFDGLSDEDVLTVGEAKKFISKLDSQYKMNIQELKMTQKYPDYQEVVTQYLPEVLKQNPGLRDSLIKTQDYELAYYLAKNSDSYKGATKKAKKSADAERIVQNANRAGSLSSVGQTSPISEAKRYKNMSDEEFKREMAKNLGYF